MLLKDLTNCIAWYFTLGHFKTVRVVSTHSLYMTSVWLQQKHLRFNIWGQAGAISNTQEGVSCYVHINDRGSERYDRKSLNSTHFVTANCAKTKSDTHSDHTTQTTPWWTLSIQSLWHWHHSQLGMLIPAGIPLEANVTMSREVKSGRRNWSFSKSLGHGSLGRRLSAELTSWANLLLMVLLTTATKPAQGKEEERVSKERVYCHDIYPCVL